MANLYKRVLQHELPNSKPSAAATNTSENNNNTSPVESEIQTSSSYLPTDGSLMSREVDRWIQGWDNGTTPNSQSIVAPKKKVISVQRSTLTSECGLNGIYCTLATVMPALTVNQRSLWNCSPSTVVTMLEPFFGHLGEVCNRIRQQFHRLITDHGMQEVFTTTLDIIMVIYAIGFVVISMYESALTA